MSDPATRIQLFQQIDAILRRFDEEEFRTFCLLYYPKVSQNITTGMVRSQMERLLKDSAEREDGLQTLLDHLQAHTKIPETPRPQAQTKSKSRQLSSQATKQLRQILLKYDNLNETLFAIDNRINPWQHEIDFSGSRAIIVDRIINVLGDKQHKQLNQHALILLLEAIKDTVHEMDYYFVELGEAIKLLKEHYYEDKPTNTKPIKQDLETEQSTQLSEQVRNTRKVNDIYTKYEKAVDELVEKLDQHPEAEDILPQADTLESRLLSNLEKSRLYGDTNETRTERAEIIDRLNTIARNHLGISFNSLVKKFRK